MDRLTDKETYPTGKVQLQKCEYPNCSYDCDGCDVTNEAMEKLKEYEDLEEQGKKMNCKFVQKSGGKTFYELEIDLERIPIRGERVRIGREGFDVGMVKTCIDGNDVTHEVEIKRSVYC